MDALKWVYGVFRHLSRLTGGSIFVEKHSQLVSHGRVSLSSFLATVFDCGSATPTTDAGDLRAGDAPGTVFAMRKMKPGVRKWIEDVEVSFTYTVIYDIPILYDRKFWT